MNTDKDFTMDCERLSIETVKEYMDRQSCIIPNSVASVRIKGYSIEPHLPSFAHFENWHSKKVTETGRDIKTNLINFVCNCDFVTVLEPSGKSLELVNRCAIPSELQDKISFQLPQVW